MIKHRNIWLIFGQKWRRLHLRLLQLSQDCPISGNTWTHRIHSRITRFLFPNAELFQSFCFLLSFHYFILVVEQAVGLIKVSPEVSEALSNGNAVVALESTIISHGKISVSGERYLLFGEHHGVHSTCLLKFLWPVFCILWFSVE